MFITNRSSFSQFPANVERVVVITLNLVILGLASISTVSTYRMRFRQPNRRPFLLGAWQNRMRVIAMAVALSISSFVLATVIPPYALTRADSGRLCHLFDCRKLPRGNAGLAAEDLSKPAVERDQIFDVLESAGAAPVLAVLNRKGC